MHIGKKPRNFLVLPCSQELKHNPAKHPKTRQPIDHEMWLVGIAMISVVRMTAFKYDHNHVNQTKQVFIKS
jgi:hypothetical protein